MASHKSPFVLFIISWQKKQVVSKKCLQVYFKMLSLFKGVIKVLHSLVVPAIKHNLPSGQVCL